MIARGGSGWQVILSDLSLILFLLAAASLAGVQPEHISKNENGPIAAMAPAQALYRAQAGGPSLGEWLSHQQPDPRTTLTIFADHAPGAEDAAWGAAQKLAASARGSGLRVRIILVEGHGGPLYASLAYDVATGGPSAAPLSISSR
ncbi:MAG: hypothetical protein V2J51_16840 [Erythrobacter sp.]|nr:hypothetical protein [Erythrobacter sp.]